MVLVHTWNEARGMTYLLNLNLLIETILINVFAKYKYNNKHSNVMHQSSVRPLYIIFMFPSLHFTMLCQLQYFINVFVFIFIAKQSKIDLYRRKGTRSKNNGTFKYAA